jgi:hypothetical protein
VCRDLIQSKRLAPGTVSAKDIGVIAAFRQQVRYLHLRFELLLQFEAQEANLSTWRTPNCDITVQYSPCSYASIAKNCTGVQVRCFGRKLPSAHVLFRS